LFDSCRDPSLPNLLEPARGPPNQAKSFEARFSSLVPNSGSEEFYEARPSSTLDSATLRLSDKTRSVTPSLSAPRLRLAPSTDAPHNKGVMCGRSQMIAGVQTPSSTTWMTTRFNSQPLDSCATWDSTPLHRKSLPAPGLNLPNQARHRKASTRWTSTPPFNPPGTALPSTATLDGVELAELLFRRWWFRHTFFTFFVRSMREPGKLGMS